VLSLRELQQRFARGLFESDETGISECIRADGLPVSARLAIYRNNLQAGFTKTLTLEFPVITRLVGTEYFRQLSLAFLSCHPSRCGDLHHVGAPFPAFLSEQFAGTAYRYLADVAALEWAYQESLVATEAAPLNPQTLRGIPVAAYGELRFHLRPACRLLHSDFPVARIWEVNQPEAAPEQTVDLDAGGDFLVVVRTRSVRIHRVHRGEFQLLTAFSDGRLLDSAVEAALAFDPEFDLGAALRRCIALGVLAEMTPPNTSQGVPNVAIS
jgi:hypothetical protein